MSRQAALLELEDVTMKFGELAACNHVSFRVDQGEFVGLIGPNGAGKTTLFNCISGFYGPTGGRISFRGADITGKQPHVICHMGAARTFQVVQSLRDMTVLENAMVGAFCRTTSPRVAKAAALEVLELTGLIAKKDQLAGNLTIPDKKRLEMARALATRPKLLMLDEVMAGLTAAEVNDAVALLRQVQKQGITLLVVEHIMEAIMPACSRVIVLDSGNVIADDVPEKVAEDPRVITAYLGERYYAQRKRLESKL